MSMIPKCSSEPISSFPYGKCSREGKNVAFVKRRKSEIESDSLPSSKQNYRGSNEDAIPLEKENDSGPLAIRHAVVGLFRSHFKG